MLRIIWARECPPGMLNSKDGHKKDFPFSSTRSSSLCYSLNSSQMTPDTSASVHSGLKHTLNCLLQFPLSAIQIYFICSSHISCQAQPSPEAPDLIPRNAFLPPDVARQGLLDSPDIPLCLLNLLRGLEETDTQGLLGALAGVVDLFAVPLGQSHPPSLVPSALPAQFLVQEVEHVARGLTAACLSRAASLGSAFPRFPWLQLPLLLLLEHLSTLVQGLPSRKHHSLHWLHSAFAILP